MARCGEERGGHAPCFMNGLVALGDGGEGGGRRGDASGFTLGWIGNVAASAVAVGDICYLNSTITIHQSNFQVA